MSNKKCRNAASEWERLKRLSGQGIWEVLANSYRTRACPVCNGAKLLVRPEIKEDKT